MFVRVLIVDDSTFFCNRLSEILSTDSEITVIGFARNGQEAIDLVQSLKPDIITMDLEMPIMDGITATRKIMSIKATPILMLSTWTSQGAKSTLEALDAGAVDYMQKPFDITAKSSQHIQQQLCQRLHSLVKNWNTPQKTLPFVKTSSSSNIQLPNVRIIAIGASTGGSVALKKVLEKLPAHFPFPILLILHMPETFTPSYAEGLNSHCNIHVKQAEDGEQIKVGTAYLAPGNMNMILKGSSRKPYIEIQKCRISQTYKPSIDITFESISMIYAKETLALVLTGMGADGKAGCQSLFEKGSKIWAQDKESSTVYGMPMVVAEAGLTEHIFSLDELGSHLSELT